MQGLGLGTARQYKERHGKARHGMEIKGYAWHGKKRKCMEIKGRIGKCKAIQGMEMHGKVRYRYRYGSRFSKTRK
jgi:hypothetical protein